MSIIEEKRRNREEKWKKLKKVIPSKMEGVWHNQMNEEGGQ